MAEAIDTTNELITQLYVAYYDRAPDPDGLLYWANLYDSGVLDLSGIAENFAMDTEAQTLYPYLKYPNLLSADDFITSLYQNMFNRAPDSEGLAYWKGQLESGAVSPGRMIVDIIYGAANNDSDQAQQDYATIQNKVEVGIYFVQEFAKTGSEWDAAAQGDAQSCLDNVTYSDSSVDTGKSDVDSALSDTGSGSTFTLTDQTDNLSGTSANDTFIGDNTTTSAGDTIDGGSGTDILKIYSTNTVPNISNVEHLYYNNPGGNIDISSKSDVTAIEIDNFGTNTLTVDTNQDITITNQSGGTTATIAGNDPTSLNITLDDDGSSTSDATIALAGTSVATLNVTTSNHASYVTVTNAGGALTTINIDGDQNISLQHALTTVTTIDASSNTGNTTIDGIGASNLTFTGGTGDDKIVMAATLTGNDTLDGGDGTDTISVSSAATINSSATVAHVSNFEVFEAAADDAVAYDVSYLDANNTLSALVISSSGGGATTTVNNINTTMADDITINGDTANNISLSVSGFVTGGTSDTATIKLDNSVTKAGNGIDVAGTLTFSNVDVLNIQTISDGTPAAAEQASIATLTATDLEKIIITGDNALSLTLGATSSGVTEVDASDLSKALTFDSNGGGSGSILVKGTDASDTITVDTAASVATVYMGDRDSATAESVVFDGGNGANGSSLQFSSESLGSGDLSGGEIDITGTGFAAADAIIINMNSTIEGLLKCGGTVLGSATANVNLFSQSSFSSNTNIYATRAGNDNAATGIDILIDVNGDGTFTAGTDLDINIIGVGADTNDTVVYDATNDYIVWTGV